MGVQATPRRRGRRKLFVSCKSQKWMAQKLEEFLKGDQDEDEDEDEGSGGQ